MIFEWTEEIAEFIGILLGDGSLGKYKCHSEKGIKTQYRVKITCDSDEDLPYIMNFVSPLMERVFKKEPLLRFKTTERVVELLLFGREYYYSLISLGLKPAPKRDNASIPEFITTENLERDFMRGLFDTDGCLVFDKQHTDRHYYPRLEIKMLPSPMRNQFINMLVQSGFDIMLAPRIYSDKVVRIQINGKEQLEEWASMIGFNNPKHKTKYLLWKRLGYCPKRMSLRERVDMLSKLEIRNSGG
ncbi:MAG: hypothetical protein V1744_04180 [Candidatus Altiarchaeota archaeon]